MYLLLYILLSICVFYFVIIWFNLVFLFDKLMLDIDIGLFLILLYFYLNIWLLFYALDHVWTYYLSAFYSVNLTFYLLFLFDYLEDMSIELLIIYFKLIFIYLLIVVSICMQYVLFGSLLLWAHTHTHTETCHIDWVVSILSWVW